MKDPVILILVLLFGISFGSFLNVLIYRLPAKESLVKPPSKCPNCGSKIRLYDNIPVISYMILGGRCRHCNKSISLRYPVIEILSGLLTVYAIYSFGFTLRGIEVVFLSLVFLAIFFIDLDHTIIPDIFTIPGIIIGIAVSLLPGSIVGWKQSLIGMAVGGGAFILVGMLGRIIFKKEALGFGDVKYAAMVGAFLGWKNLILMLIIASFLGSIIGISLIYLSGKKGKSTYIPFGPFLTVGAWISIYFGDYLIKAYLELAGI
ncbi:MAG: prepilin peptidase [Candidatus Zixiibacteriota bacterium]|nr:MAG: prepilin peptidase [candidate division Zixibacteria bacterium]